jgi:hypothetical protein
VRVKDTDVEKQGDSFVLKVARHVKVDAKVDEHGKPVYTTFLHVLDWVGATPDIDVDTGKSEKAEETFFVINKIDPEEVEKKGDVFVLKADPTRIDARAFKMSKARGNVINPDDVVREYGADSLRLFEMFMGPLEAVKPWSMAGVEGVYRFLGRVWRMIIDDRAETMKLSAAVQEVEPDRETQRLLHRTIQKVTEDLEAQPIPRFNTAIAAMMEFTNHLTRLESRPKALLSTFVLLLSPFAPHLAEELWHALGHTDTLAYEPWPTFDPALTKAEEVEVPVQINGKLRTRILVPPDIDKTTLEKTALADEKVKALLEGKQVKKLIVVPGKLVNVVVGGASLSSEVFSATKKQAEPMARKVAVVLRGPPGAGKSQVASALQVHYAQSSRVELDRYWGPGEQRYAGTCRYGDLRNQPDVLIVELGYGEPAGESFPGATKNPREWVGILENDGREVFFFLLDIQESESLKRVSNRNDLPLAYAKLAHDRYKPGGVCSSAVFSVLLGAAHAEETISTEQQDLAATVARIVTKVGKV